MSIGFMKDIGNKGNLNMLNESELVFVKQLLKQANNDLWRNEGNLNGLHRQCKLTIRKLTRQMANIELYAVLKHLKEPSREHTLSLVYRAENLFHALSESQKIFKLISQSIFDSREFDRIVTDRSISAND